VRLISLIENPKLYIKGIRICETFFVDLKNDIKEETVLYHHFDVLIIFPFVLLITSVVSPIFIIAGYLLTDFTTALVLTDFFCFINIAFIIIRDP